MTRLPDKGVEGLGMSDEVISNVVALSGHCGPSAKGFPQATRVDPTVRSNLASSQAHPLWAKRQVE